MRQKLKTVYTSLSAEMYEVLGQFYQGAVITL